MLSLSHLKRTEPLILDYAYWYLLERSLPEEYESGIIIMIQLTLTIVVISTERVNYEAVLKYSVDRQESAAICLASWSMRAVQW